MIQMAITYCNDSDLAHIRLYRNGQIFGNYTKGPFASWPAGDTEVFWGIRNGHRAHNGGPHDMDAHIEESRIYTGVLTDVEIKRLTPKS